MANPTSQSLLLPLLLSSCAHGGALGVFGLWSLLSALLFPPTPPIDRDRTMEVAMVVLPKSAGRMPDKAIRTPKPAGADTPTAQPRPEVNHTSDLVVKQKNAVAPKGVDQKKLDDAMRQMEMDAAMADMEAMIGTIDQAATDPNGDANAPALTGAIGKASDPELVRYIKKLEDLFKAQFHPLQSIRNANPGIKVVVHVSVDPATGKVLGSAIRTPSGVGAFDSAATRAVAAVSTIPLPPAKYQDRVAEGYDIEFD